MITLYTTHCPQCRVLETKLAQKNIQYEVCEDQDFMKEKGFLSVPILEVDGEVLNFANAIKWVNDQK